MSTRVTINIGFYFDHQHYAQLQAFIPRTEAKTIPQLRLQENIVEQRAQAIPRPTRAAAKKDSEDENSEGEEDDNNMPNDMDIEMENEDEGLMDQEQQKEMENALQMLEEDEPEDFEEEDNYDSDRIEDDQEEEDIDIDSLSNPSVVRNFTNIRTKRQKGETKDLIQLPDRRPRKDKLVDQANEIVRREEKERKRKQYLKKQTEAQEKATLDKILNETGRKLRMREEKEIKEVMEREQKLFKTLGNVPKIITLIDERGHTVMVHKAKLFSERMTTAPDLKMKQLCSSCGNQSKYKLKNQQTFACSLPCYKLLQA